MATLTRHLDRLAVDRHSRRRNALGLTVGAVIGLALVTLVALWALSGSPQTLLDELAKTLMQVLLVVGVGALLSFAVDVYQDRRATRTAEAELIRSMIGELLDAYHTVKGSRRLMRARLPAGVTDDVVDLTAYDDQMSTVVQAQLRFERLNNMASLLGGPEPWESLKERLGAVEEQLHRVCKEYEIHRKRIAHSGPIPLSSLPEAAMFVARGDDGGNFGTVSRPVRDAITYLETELYERAGARIAQPGQAAGHLPPPPR